MVILYFPKASCVGIASSHTHRLSLVKFHEIRLTLEAKQDNSKVKFLDQNALLLKTSKWVQHHAPGIREPGEFLPSDQGQNPPPRLNLGHKNIVKIHLFFLFITFKRAKFMSNIDA